MSKPTFYVTAVIVRRLLSGGCIWAVCTNCGVSYFPSTSVPKIAVEFVQKMAERSDFFEIAPETILFALDAGNGGV